MNENNTNSVSASNRAEINFKPWTDIGFRIVELHLVESLGGEVANGYIDLWLPDEDNALKYVTEQNTGTITIEDKSKENGVSYNIPVFIENRKFFRNTLTLNVSCIGDSRFFTESLSNISFPNIDNALETLYFGKLDKRTESDINNQIPIFQFNETNYSLCKKLAMSYKYDSIFAFGWEGFLIKDRIGINSYGKNENNNILAVNGGSDINNTTPYTLCYNKFLNHTPINPWETETNEGLKAKNCRSIVTYNKYSIMGTNYSQLIDNYKYNERLINSSLYSTISLTSTVIPTYKLGDIIIYKRPEETTSKPFEKYLITSNEIFISQNGASHVGPHGFKFEWSSKLLGIEKGTWNENNKENEIL